MVGGVRQLAHTRGLLASAAHPRAPGGCTATACRSLGGALMGARGIASVVLVAMAVANRATAGFVRDKKSVAGTPPKGEPPLPPRADGAA